MSYHLFNRPGEGSIYKTLCEEQKTEKACARAKDTCTWEGSTPTPAGRGQSHRMQLPRQLKIMNVIAVFLNLHL